MDREVLGGDSWEHPIWRMLRDCKPNHPVRIEHVNGSGNPRWPLEPGSFGEGDPLPRSTSMGGNRATVNRIRMTRRSSRARAAVASFRRRQWASLCRLNSGDNLLQGSLIVSPDRNSISRGRDFWSLPARCLRLRCVCNPLTPGAGRSSKWARIVGSLRDE